jgi:hypothetical protein
VSETIETLAARLDRLQQSLDALLARSSAPAPAGDELLTKAEAVKLCKVSVKSFDAWIRPKVTVVRVGRRPMFRRDELARFGETQAEATAPSRPKGKTTNRAARGRQLSPRALELAERLARRATGVANA